MFGLLSWSGGEWTYRPEWAHDEDEERALAATVIDAIHERLRDDPAMHVTIRARRGQRRSSGSACSTRSARPSSTSCCGVMSSSISAGGRQAVRVRPRRLRAQAGREAPGLRAHGRGGRGADAVLEYERYLGSRDPSHLRAIESYNAEDCRSTVAVLDWLRDQAPGDVTWLAADDGRPEEVESRSRASESCFASSSSRASPRAASAGSRASCSPTTVARRSSSGGPTSRAGR